MTIQYSITSTLNGNTVINAILGNGTQISIPKDPANSDYRQYLKDVTQAVADQAELNAIAKAKVDAQAQADAAANAKATADFTAQLAAANAKLMALGLTATDVSALLNAAKA